MKRAAWCSLLAIFPLCAAGQVYKWVDEQGKVHYGDRPMAKEVKNVPVLREARPKEALPAPGMKVDELRKAYGEPDRTQIIRTKNGETLIWTYRRSKTVAKDFVAKLEGGEVTEVSTDSFASAAPVPAAAGAVGSRNAAADDVYVREQEAAVHAAAAKKRRCDSLKEGLQRAEDAERRGGSGATMDRLRDEKRRQLDKISAEGCSVL